MMKLSMLYIMIITQNVFYVLGLTCNQIVELPENQKITLKDLQETQPKDIIECLPHLGKEKIPMEEAEYIWDILVTYYDGPPNVPENVMMLLHWVTPALKVEDYANITLSNIDVIQNFGFNYNLSQPQLFAIAERVREDFAGKQPEDYSYYDLIALRQILCAFKQSEIERIRPTVYRETAVIIGKLDQCPREVMQAFAYLAIQPRAFGEPSLWTDSTIESVGIIANYIFKENIEKNHTKIMQQN